VSKRLLSLPNEMKVIEVYLLVYESLKIKESNSFYDKKCGKL